MIDPSNVIPKYYQLANILRLQIENEEFLDALKSVL